MKSAHFNLSNDKAFRKRKMPKFETKNAVLKIFHQNFLIWVCLGWNLKTILSYLKSAPSTKVLKFATKKALFAYFGLEFEKSVIIFEISTLEFV